MPNKNPSPKSVFLANEKLVKAHARMLESQDFLLAVDTAKAQYIHRLHGSAPNDLTSPNFGTAAAYSFERMQGMMDFVEILLNLGENNPAPVAVKEPLNLMEMKKN